MKQPISKSAYEGEALPFGDKPQAIGASFTVVKVIREHCPVFAGGTATFGELLDRHLAECAEHGDEVQTVEFHIEPELWLEFAAGKRGQ